MLGSFSPYRASPYPRELTCLECQAVQHHYATECPSLFIRVRGEAPPGWKVDSPGRAAKDESAWNGPEFTDAARARYREFITKLSLPPHVAFLVTVDDIVGPAPANPPPGAGEGPMSVQGRPPRASVRRPPGEDKALAGSAAPSSGALAAVARQLGMSEEDIFDLALARSAWRSMVVVRLGAGHARLAWSKTPMPALTNLAELGHASAFAGVDWERHLHDDSAPSELERAGAQWPDGWGHQAAARGRRSRRLHRSSIGTSRRLSGGRAPGRTTGEHGAWSSLGDGTQGAGCGHADVAHDAESADVGLGLRRRRSSWYGRRCRLGTGSSIFRRR
jgi:hypothetical protein